MTPYLVKVKDRICKIIAVAIPTSTGQTIQGSISPELLCETQICVWSLKRPILFQQ